MMYIHSDFEGNPTYTNTTAPYYPAKLRKKLEAIKQEALEYWRNLPDIS